jgi:hypothetical protein
MGYILSIVSILQYYLNISLPGVKFHIYGSDSEIEWLSTSLKLQLTHNGHESFLDALGILNYCILFIASQTGVAAQPETTLDNIVNICLSFSQRPEISFDYELKDIIQEMSDYILL